MRGARQAAVRGSVLSVRGEDVIGFKTLSPMRVPLFTPSAESAGVQALFCEIVVSPEDTETYKSDRDRQTHWD